MEKKYKAPAVDRLLDIIELLAASDQGYSFNEIARELGMPVNTVYRICQELLSRQYLERSYTDGLYRLGSRFFIVGQQVGSRIDLRTKALPYMKELRDQSGETVHLCIRQEDRMVLLDQVESRQPIRSHVETGALMYLHPSAFGKCLLAYATPEFLVEYFSKPLIRLTEHTIVDQDRLSRELEKIRVRHIAHDWEEYMTGVHCIGAAIHSNTGLGIASIGVTGPASRLSEGVMEMLMPAVQTAAKDISTGMGYSLTGSLPE